MPLEETTLTPEQALAQLKELATTELDIETQHINGDIVVYQLLLGLGHTEVAAQYKKMTCEWWHG